MAKDSQSGNPVLGLVVLGALSFILYSCFSGGEESEADRSARLAKEAEDKRRGFHCLSAWDGSHRDFKNAVKDKMRDPDSFEHIETRVTPVDGSGNHIMFMEYRARNGFGGMNVGTAAGSFRNSDCGFTVLAIE